MPQLEGRHTSQSPGIAAYAAFATLVAQLAASVAVLQVVILRSKRFDIWIS